MFKNTEKTNDTYYNEVKNVKNACVEIYIISRKRPFTFKWVWCSKNHNVCDIICEILKQINDHFECCSQCGNFWSHSVDNLVISSSVLLNA